MSDLQVGELAALATACLWTVSSLIWTSAGKQIGALAVALYRLLMAIVLLMVYGRLVCGACLPTDASLRTWLLLATSGFFGFFLSDICLFKALLLIGPRLTLLILSLAPPLAALISWAMIGDVLAPRHWLAMGVTVLGVAWVVVEKSSNDPHPLARWHWRQGVVLAVMAAATQATGMVLAKKGIGDYDAVTATLIRALGALPGYVVLLTLWRRWPAMRAALRHPRPMVIMLLGAIVGPFAGVALNMVALRHAPTGVVATIIATMPVLVLPWSIVIDGERVSLRAVGGAVVAIAGVALLML